MKANRHGRAFLGDREITVNDHDAVSGAMGHAAMADLVAGDRLKVQVRGCKRGDPATMELLAEARRRPSGARQASLGASREL